MHLTPCISHPFYTAALLLTTKAETTTRSQFPLQCLTWWCAFHRQLLTNSVWKLCCAPEDVTGIISNPACLGSSSACWDQHPHSNNTAPAWSCCHTQHFWGPQWYSTMIFNCRITLPCAPNTCQSQQEPQHILGDQTSMGHTARTSSITPSLKPTGQSLQRELGLPHPRAWCVKMSEAGSWHHHMQHGSELGLLLGNILSTGSSCSWPRDSTGAHQPITNVHV